MKSKKVNIGESIVPYSPQNYSNPYGSATYSGGQMNLSLSPENQQQYTTRQQLINELLPELNATRSGQNQRIQSMTDLMNQQLLQYAEPEMYGSFAARGMQDSTLANNALNDLRIKAGESAIFGGQDLYNQELQNMLSTGTFLQGGLNDIYSQLMGIGNQAQANNQQYFAQQNANADRLLQGNMANANAVNSRNTAMMNDLGMLTGAMFMPVGASAAGSGGGTNGFMSLMNMFRQKPANVMDDTQRYFSPNNPYRQPAGYPSWY